MTLARPAAALLAALTAIPAAAQETEAQDSAALPEMPEIFTGEFETVNLLGETTGVAGTVTLSETPDGRLTITMVASGLTPGMHLAHVHGFAEAEPADAVCPADTADANADGYVDLIETRELSGVTMIPFTADPASLELLAETYPEAGPAGSMSYSQDVSLDALEQAVQEKFDTPLALGTRVVYIHGAPEGMDLPDSVASLEGVPAETTIPLACAELSPARN